LRKQLPRSFHKVENKVFRDFRLSLNGIKFIQLVRFLTAAHCPILRRELE
jgi:hypothetical protein